MSKRKPKLSELPEQGNSTKPLLANRLGFRRNYWLDYYMNNYKWYRALRKGIWHKHQFSTDALQLSVTFQGTFWARYGKINRYSDVIAYEVY